MSARFFTLVCAASIASAFSARAQLAEPNASDAVRVTVSENEDGSRTAYRFDTANHKATATTTNRAGKTLKKIRYDLDDAGRFSAGEVCGPDGKLRFKTQYKYDGTGRLIQETQLTKEDVVQNRIVYSYDQDGKQTGYAVYDGDGRLLGQTTPMTGKAPPKKKAK